MLVARIDSPAGKRFSQAHMENGEVVGSAPPKPWPIYNRTRLAEAKMIIVVEGEKCVHAIHEAGYTATTSPAGAGKAKLADWTPLSGKTAAVLWPDNDEAGINHMREVAEILKALPSPPQMFWVDPVTIGIGPKGDAADVIEQAGELADERICSILDQAKPMDGAGELGGHLEDIISGLRKAIPFPWPGISALTQALKPGTVTGLCGGPGAAKSLCVMQAVRYWASLGIPQAVYMLEDDKNFHLQRLLAQEAKNANLTDDSWIQANSGEVMALHREHAAMISQVSKVMFAAPDRSIGCEEMLMWVRQVCSAGARIVIIDPVTAIDFGDHGSFVQNQERFLHQIKGILRRHIASLLYVTHPRGGKTSGDPLDDMAGSRAWGRFTQTVFWLQSLPAERTVRVKTSFAEDVVKCNRIIRIAKCRYGKGEHAQMAMTFSRDDLRFHEHGMILRDVDEA